LQQLRSPTPVPGGVQEEPHVQHRHHRQRRAHPGHPGPRQLRHEPGHRAARPRDDRSHSASQVSTGTSYGSAASAPPDIGEWFSYTVTDTSSYGGWLVSHTSTTSPSRSGSSRIFGSCTSNSTREMPADAGVRPTRTSAPVVVVPMT